MMIDSLASPGNPQRPNKSPVTSGDFLSAEKSSSQLSHPFFTRSVASAGKGGASPDVAAMEVVDGLDNDGLLGKSCLWQQSA